MKQKTIRKLLGVLLALAMYVGLVPGMGLTAYAAGGGTEVTQANVICQQYSYMDADYYSGGVLNDTPPADITNIELADAQAFGAAVNCPTTYWVVVYAKDGDNLKWTSNGKTGEQTSTPLSASGRVLSAWFVLYNNDVFFLPEDPMRGLTFYFSKGLATVSVTGVSLDKTTAQTIEVDGKVSFTATVSPNNATDKTVKWSVGGTDTGAVKLYTDENCTTEVGANATSTMTVYAKGMSAGSATVTATATNGTDDTADDKSASCNVTVNPVTYEVTYQVVNGTWSDGSKADKKETVQSGAKPASVPIGMKASSGYTGGAWDTDPASATITGAKTFIFTFTAKQAATVTKVPVAKPLTYNGSAQELVTAGTATGGTMQYALGTATEATQPYTTTIPTKTNAGTYYVWYKVVGDANHADTEAACVIVTIGEAEAEKLYYTVSGDGQDHVIESGEDATFTVKRSTADDTTFSRFSSIQVDGADVDEGNYDKSAGSVIIKLKAAYLDTLSVGSHILKVLFTDGSVDIPFTVSKAAAADSVPAATQIPVATEAYNIPKTGDAADLVLWAGALILGAVGLAMLKKRKHN